MNIQATGTQKYLKIHLLDKRMHPKDSQINLLLYKSKIKNPVWTSIVFEVVKKKKKNVWKLSSVSAQDADAIQRGSAN